MKRPWLACADCELPYSDDGWADFVVSDAVWAQLTKEDDAEVLCMNCMTRRAKRIGVEAQARIASGPFVDAEWLLSGPSLNERRLESPAGETAPAALSDDWRDGVEPGLGAVPGKEAPASRPGTEEMLTWLCRFKWPREGPPFGQAWESFARAKAEAIRIVTAHEKAREYLSATTLRPGAMVSAAHLLAILDGKEGT